MPLSLTHPDTAIGAGEWAAYQDYFIELQEGWDSLLEPFVRNGLGLGLGLTPRATLGLP